MIPLMVIFGLLIFVTGIVVGAWLKQGEVRAYVEKERKSALFNKKDFEKSDPRASWWAGTENALDLLAYNVLRKPDVT